VDLGLLPTTPPLAVQPGETCLSKLDL